MSIMIGDLKVYSVEDLAELLSIQERTARKLIRNGTFKGTKLAGRWYVTEEELQAYFRRQGEVKTQ